MSLVDFLSVESTNLNEGNCYKSILSDIISDLRLSSSIECLKCIIIPESSLFIISSLIKKTEKNIYIKDICQIKFDFKNEKSLLILEIEREKYIPELTSYLWLLFSRSQVNQVDRWTIEVDITGLNIDIENIKNHILENQNLVLQKNMIELAIRACPEGFKVRYHNFSEQGFIFIGSEEPITTNLKKIAQDELLKLVNKFYG